MQTVKQGRRAASGKGFGTWRQIDDVVNSDVGWKEICPRRKPRGPKPGT